MPNEKNWACAGDLVGADARAGKLDHRPDHVLERRRLLGPYALGQLAQAAKLLGEADERVHDLDVAAPRRCRSSTASAARAIARICIS